MDACGLRQVAEVSGIRSKDVVTVAGQADDRRVDRVCGRCVRALCGWRADLLRI